jgi:hypothetical protein
VVLLPRGLLVLRLSPGLQVQILQHALGSQRGQDQDRGIQLKQLEENVRVCQCAASRFANIQHTDLRVCEEQYSVVQIQRVFSALGRACSLC